MTVGELIERLRAYDEEVEVLVQGPSDIGDPIWPMYPVLGETEEEVVIMATHRGVEVPSG